MRDSWGPPATGWPSFDAEGRRVDDEEVEACAMTLTEARERITRATPAEAEAAACHERNVSCPEHPRTVPDVAGRDLLRFPEPLRFPKPSDWDITHVATDGGLLPIDDA